MQRRIFIVGICILLSIQIQAFSATGDPGDVEGSKDPSIFTRMPGFHISGYTESEFERYEIPIAGDFKTQAIEGRFLHIQYEINEGVKQPSGLQIVRNYANAAATIGGKKIVEFEDGGIQYVTLKITKGSSEIWAHIEGTGSRYTLRMVEKQLMQQDVVADAASLASSIKDSGKASVYGIYFDTGKADIKPESESALQEIAKMLRADAAMKLYVVGHTDNTGNFSSNVSLSNARADAVVKALAGQYSIALSRLQPFGAGPTSPVQSNRTEEGRAKNRRVELVLQ